MYALLALFLPGFVYAKELSGVLGDIKNQLTSIPALLLAVATIYFLWNVVGYVGAGADEKSRTEAMQGIAWGLFGLFAIVAMWGLVSVAKSTIGL
ncbi:MAG: hypothetical protein WC797_01205 [Candidatus Paceibacterota bacterium]|jgi:hypothetical protein